MVPTPALPIDVPSVRVAATPLGAATALVASLLLSLAPLLLIG